MNYLPTMSSFFSSSSKVNEPAVPSIQPGNTAALNTRSNTPSLQPGTNGALNLITKSTLPQMNNTTPPPMNTIKIKNMNEAQLLKKEQNHNCGVFGSGSDCKALTIRKKILKKVNQAVTELNSSTDKKTTLENIEKRLRQSTVESDMGDIMEEIRRLSGMNQQGGSRKSKRKSRRKSKRRKTRR
jgi:hypothetical protein